MSTEIAILFGASFFAGLVDSIGGGGGLILVPTLLTVKFPAMFLLGTNKSINVVGSSVSVFRYRQAKLLPEFGKRWLFFVAAALSGGALGAAISTLGMYLKNLELIIPALLVGVMSFLGYRWFLKEPVEVSAQPVRATEATAVVGAIGGYDGVFGPGTGTFYLSYFESCGFSTLQANAAAKVFNVSSNLGALLVFLCLGRVMWRVGLACAAATMLGNYLGSGIVLKRGQAWVRATVMLTTGAMLIRFFWLRFQ